MSQRINEHMSERNCKFSNIYTVGLFKNLNLRTSDKRDYSIGTLRTRLHLLKDPNSLFKLSFKRAISEKKNLNA